MDSYDLACNELRHIAANLNVKVSLLMLRCIGNWPPQGRYRYLYIIYTIGCFVIAPGIYMFIQAAYLIKEWGDMEKMIAGSFLLMTNTGHSYKMFVIVFRQKRIQALLDVLTSDDFFYNSYEHERIFTWYAWNGIFHHAAYQSVGAIAVLCWAAAPINNILSGGDRRLPVQESWYPCDTDKSPAFEITCIHQIIAVIILTFHNIAMDTLATNLIIVACCQLEILKRNIVAIGNGNVDEKSQNSDGEACSKLNYCVKHNKIIVSFVKEIQDIFGASIIYHFFVDCVTVCFAAVHISKMKDTVVAEIIGTTMYTIAIMYQVFIYCWHSNELTLQSESVSLAAYASNWWQFGERYKNTLKIVMIRTHHPLIIKAGGILTVSLDTFTSIIRMSYSLFTVLQTSSVH